MTREEAKEILQGSRITSFRPNGTARVKEALALAIEALSQPIVCKDYCIDDDHIYCSPKVADRVVEALSVDAVQTDLVQRSDVLEVISEAQDGSGSTYNILQPIFVKVNNLPSCHRCYECDEQFYQQILEKGMIELPQEYVSVVRCKDCRHRDLFSCPLADNDFQKEEHFCSWGERGEE